MRSLLSNVGALVSGLQGLVMESRPGEAEHHPGVLRQPAACVKLLTLVGRNSNGIIHSSYIIAISPEKGPRGREAWKGTCWPRFWPNWCQNRGQGGSYTRLRLSLRCMSLAAVWEVCNLYLTDKVSKDGERSEISIFSASSEESMQTKMTCSIFLATWNIWWSVQKIFWPQTELLNINVF